MPRGLCQDCLQSFDETELVRLGTRLLCSNCSGRAQAALAKESAAACGTGVPAPVARFVDPPDSLLVRLRDDAVAWAAGRSWVVRLPFLAWFAYILVRHWGDPMYQSLFKGLNLGIHELGHPLFSFLGPFMTAAGGTLLQCLAPVLSVGMFVRQRDYFAIAVCFAWLSTNFFDVATYAGDARAMQLPLVSPGGGGGYIEDMHDWHNMLGRMGMLSWDGTIAFLFRAAGSVSMLAALAGGAWLCWRMFKTRDEMPPME
jgi:hypothetical protein